MSVCTFLQNLTTLLHYFVLFSVRMMSTCNCGKGNFYALQNVCVYFSIHYAPKMAIFMVSGATVEANSSLLTLVSVVVVHGS